jgi:hypothetical protein
VGGMGSERWIEEEGKGEERRRELNRGRVGGGKRGEQKWAGQGRTKGRERQAVGPSGFSLLGSSLWVPLGWCHDSPTPTTSSSRLTAANIHLATRLRGMHGQIWLRQPCVTLLDQPCSVLLVLNPLMMLLAA